MRRDILGPYLMFVDFFAVKLDGSDFHPGIWNLSGCFNVQTSHGFENFCLFLSNSTYSLQNQVVYL